MPRDNIPSEMIRFAFVTFAFVFTICHVNGLYSHGCKESETSSDKIVRFLENVNCTLAQGQRKFEQKLNFLQEHFKRKLEFFSHKMTTSRPDGNENCDGGSIGNPSYPLPMTPDPIFDDQEKVNRPKPQPVVPLPDFDDQANEKPSNSLSTTALPGYEGLDHPIDIRMSFDDYSHRAASRPRRDVDEEGVESENQGKSSSDDELRPSGASP